MGLKPLLTEGVNFVLHGAATVYFSEKLRAGVCINVAGRQNIL
jgi:hypothetical protein